MIDAEKMLPVMEQIVREAGACLLDREESRKVHEKGYADFVTEVDLQVQQIVSGRLMTAFPEIQFMGEEKDNSDVDFTKAFWILDPVDGTTNLIHDLRMSAISLALAVDSRTVAGVIYQPWLGELFSAARGCGAFLNGRPMHVSTPQNLRDCILALGTSPYHRDLADRTFACARKAFCASMDIRRSGSAALDLAYVAAGRVDGMFELILQPWDFAAGMLLVEEAGGRITTVEGEPVCVTRPSGILATNGLIHEELRGLLSEPKKRTEGQILGAIIGDIVGSRFEWHNRKTRNFSLFKPECGMTDDSIMTLAVAKAILDSRPDWSDLEEKTVFWMQHIGRRFPRCGFGRRFSQWLQEEDPRPYGSYGNGAAMRCSSCGYAAGSLEEAVSLAHAVTAVTHNHPESFRAAEATAGAIYLARTGHSIPEIRAFIQENYDPLHFTLDEIRPGYSFDVSCRGSVPQAIEAFLESSDYESAIRNAVSIGGDSDTIAAITGGIAAAYYGIPEELRKAGLSYVQDTQLRKILEEFEARYSE